MMILKDNRIKIKYKGRCWFQRAFVGTHFLLVREAVNPWIKNAIYTVSYSHCNRLVLLTGLSVFCSVTK